MTLNRLDALQPVEIAVLLLDAGQRPLPLDPTTGRPLLNVKRHKGDGDLDENTIRGWFFDRPDAALGVLQPDGTVEVFDAKVAAEAEAALRRRAVERVAHRLTDMGNAARFEKRHGCNVRYCPAWGKWIIWNGRRWRLDDRLEIMEMCKDTALAIYEEVRDAAGDAMTCGDSEEKRKEAEKRTKALLKHAAASQRKERLAAMEIVARSALAVTPDELDMDGWALNVENGTVDLRTGVLRPHRRDDLITKLAPVVYDAQAEYPRWLAFLDRVMAGNHVLINYIRRLAGMSLTSDVREQILPIFYGRGANGKSVLLDTLTGLMGEYAAEAPPDLLIVRRNQEHPTEIADLCGRRLVVAAETEEGGRLRISLLKRLTGNARLKARFMCRDYFEFTRTHKLMLATNSKPAVREGTHAVWRRIRLVPLDVVIPEAEQDKDLTTKLRAEWPGILRWCIEGCLAWQRHGLQTPEEVVDATQTYEGEEDVLAEFLAECTIRAANAHAARPDVWAAYREWCKRRRERWPLGRNVLYENLRGRPGIEDVEKKISGRTTRVFTGLGLVATDAPIADPREGQQSRLPY